MTFSARKTLADLALEPFPFEDLDGEARQLPNLKAVRADLMEQFYDGSMFDVLTALVEDDLVGEATLAAIRAMPIGVVTQLAGAWLSHSEAEPGESAASLRSSASTARRSKPTSRASTGSKTRKR